MKRRRPRRKFKTTGNESILSFVKAAGAKGVSGAQLVQHWKAEGRGVGCYNLLGKLIKEKKIVSFRQACVATNYPDAGRRADAIQRAAAEGTAGCWSVAR